MIVAYCDVCGRRIFQTTPGQTVFSHPFVRTSENGREVEYQFHAGCMDEGLRVLSRDHYPVPRSYECDREPVAVGMEH